MHVEACIRSGRSIEPLRAQGACESAMRGGLGMGRRKTVDRSQGRANRCWCAHRNILRDTELPMSSGEYAVACGVVPCGELGWCLEGCLE